MRDVQQYQKKIFDEKRKEARTYVIGDLVLAKISSIVTRVESKKLRAAYKGPLSVIEVLENDRYKLKNVLGIMANRKYEGVYAAESLKPWIVF